MAGEFTTAAFVACDRDTIRNERKRDPLFDANVSRAKEMRTIEPLDVIIRRHIEAALTDTQGRVEGPLGAARLLRINPHTLRARMRKLKINWQAFRRGPST